MLSTAVRRLVNLWAVQPGQRAVVLTANPEGDAAIADLERRRRRGRRGRRRPPRRDDRRRATGARGCARSSWATAAASTATCSSPPIGWTAPTVAAQPWPATARSTTRAAARFVPGPARCPTTSWPPAGSPATARSTSCVEHADAVGAARRRRPRALARHRPAATAGSEPLPGAAGAAADPTPSCSADAPHGFVDFSEDVSSKDIVTAAREGYDSVELVKRYTTVTMGPAQGKLETVNAVAVARRGHRQHDRRDGHHHVAADVRAGHARRAGRPDRSSPCGYSPMQPWHERHGARAAGRRPVDPARPLRRPRRRGARRARPRSGSSTSPRSASSTCAARTCRSCSNLLYVNKWSKLDVGRGALRGHVRRGRRGARRRRHRPARRATTTSCRPRPRARPRCGSGSSAGCRPRTRVAGPRHPGDHGVRQHQRRRAPLARAARPADRWRRPGVRGLRLHAASAPARVAGVADCVLWRIGFTGELSYEIHVPAAYGLHVWER